MIPDLSSDDTKRPDRAETAPTRFVTVGDVRYAYRRFGKPGGIPLVFFQHFRGSMDNWDPALINGFAQDRPVVLFDNAGVGFSTGDVPTTIAGMARHAVAVIEALDLREVDLPFRYRFFRKGGGKETARRRHLLR